MEVFIRYLLELYVLNTRILHFKKPQQVLFEIMPVFCRDNHLV